jgi:hypothetical protein
MSTTTPRWVPDEMGPRDLMRVPRLWPLTTAWVAGTMLAFVALCWMETAR